MRRAFSLLWPCLLGALAVFPAACSSTVAPPPVPTPTSTPTPTPTPVPPSKTIAPSVTTIDFTSTAAQTFSVSEAGYNGSFSAQSSNSSVATVVPIDTRNDTFSVTPVAGGTATITVSDTIGDTVTISVTVTGATLTPQFHS